MFVERLTEIEINKFRILTPLTVDGKVVPYRVYCNGKFYNDLRGTSQYIVFLRDFSCSAPFATENAKANLKRHYRQFMMNVIGDEYKNALSVHLFKNSSTEQTSEQEHTL